MIKTNKIQCVKMACWHFLPVCSSQANCIAFTLKFHIQTNMDGISLKKENDNKWTNSILGQTDVMLVFTSL